MATRKITITVPEELVESIKERVDARGVSGYIAAAAAHQDAMDRLRELADRLEEEELFAGGVEDECGLERRLGEPSEMAARAHRPNEDVAIEEVVGETDAIA